MNKLLKDLARQGCHPGIYRYGEHLWRAYVNAGGAFWVDASTPIKALRGAVQEWERCGKPTDGFAER